MALGRTIPALPVRDVVAAVSFYGERLGFTALHQDAGFAVLRRDDAVLHLWEASDVSWDGRAAAEPAVGAGPAGRGPVCSGAESFLAGTASCRIEATDIEALYAEMQAAFVLHPAASSLQDTDFGTREFAVLDLDGNLIAFHTWLA